MPRHLKKVNRQVLRSVAQEGAANLEPSPLPPSSPRPLRQLKKQAKAQNLKERMERIPSHPTLEDRNKQMRKRVPMFEVDNHERPKLGARPTRKKVPRK
jgi:hypothetical protein